MSSHRSRCFYPMSSRSALNVASVPDDNHHTSTTSISACLLQANENDCLKQYLSSVHHQHAADSLVAAPTTSVSAAADRAVPYLARKPETSVAPIVAVSAEEHVSSATAARHWTTTTTTATPAPPRRTSTATSAAHLVNRSLSRKRPSFAERISQDIERSRHIVADEEESTSSENTSLTSQSEAAHPPVADEKAKPAHNTVAVEPHGVVCCPLTRRSRNRDSAPVTLPEEPNLSPFKTWDFKRFLPVRAEDSSEAGAHTHRNTLVLDLDETLVHTSTEYMPDADSVIVLRYPVADTTTEATTTTTTTDAAAAPGKAPQQLQQYTLYIKYRPHLKEFMRYCVEHFEVVIFTASRKYYAKGVLAQLEKDIPCLHFVPPETAASGPHGGGKEGVYNIPVLHRDHCTPTNAGFVKDLFLLGRDLSRIVLIDNNIMCGVFQPYNFVQVKDFVRRRASCNEEEGDGEANGANGVSTPAKPSLAEVKGTAGPNAITEAVTEAEADRSTYEWDDPEDPVLRSLIEKGALLDVLSTSQSVPKALLSAMQRSR